MIKKITIAALLIIIARLVVTYVTRNTAVKWAVKEGSSSAVSVERQLSSANFGLTAKD